MTDPEFPPPDAAPPASGASPYAAPPAYGASPYAAPQPYAAPAPYGAPPTYGWAPPTSPGTDGLAVAALVLGIVPIFAGILGVVFGIAALRRIRRTGAGGRGMAIAGIVLGAIWMVLVAGMLIARGSSTVTTSRNATTGVIDSSGDVPVRTLRVGDCVRHLQLNIASRTVPVVPCGQPHEAEVYWTGDLALPAYPGDAEMLRRAEGACLRAAQTSAVMKPNDDINYLRPTAASWRRGDHGVICLRIVG